MVEVTSTQDCLVRRAILELLRATGTASCGSILAPGVRWHEPGRSLVAGDYEGCDEVRSSLFARFRELSGGTFRVTGWDGVRTDETREVAMYVVQARRGGRALLSRDVCVADVRDDLITAVQVYHADQHAWDRFWS
jgi:ketosteroid isomerase-like protein